MHCGDFIFIMGCVEVSPAPYCFFSTINQTQPGLKAGMNTCKYLKYSNMQILRLIQAPIAKASEEDVQMVKLVQMVQMVGGSGYLFFGGKENWFV